MTIASTLSALLAAPTLAGCSFKSPSAGGTADDAGGSGGMHDTMPGGGGDEQMPTIDAQQCFGTGLVKVCLDAAPTTPLTLTGSVVTDDENCTQVFQQTGAGAPDLCVMAGSDVTITNVIATGSRALVVIGAHGISVPAGSTLDVSSSVVQIGAAANRGTCAAAGAGAHDRGGAGGGGGGGFATKGAPGGAGDLNDNFPPDGSAAPGAGANATFPPTVLRGGCPGGEGGLGDADPNGLGGGGKAGAGGGAVYLISAGAITIDGDVFASGAGGRATTGTNGFEEGGGGGGAGGMIGLDGASVAIAGRIAANGGAGAGGGGNVGGTSGGNGSTTSWNVAAGHGTGDATGSAGNGGDGSAINIAPMPGASADAGAGGGAGSVGVVWIDGTVTGGAMVSPAPSAH